MNEGSNLSVLLRHRIRIDAHIPTHHAIHRAPRVEERFRRRVSRNERNVLISQVDVERRRVLLDNAKKQARNAHGVQNDRSVLPQFRVQFQLLHDALVHVLRGNQHHDCVLHVLSRPVVSLIISATPHTHHIRNMPLGMHIHTGDPQIALHTVILRRLARARQRVLLQRVLLQVGRELVTHSGREEGDHAGREGGEERKARFRGDLLLDREKLEGQRKAVEVLQEQRRRRKGDQSAHNPSGQPSLHQSPIAVYVDGRTGSLPHRQTARLDRP